MLPQKIVTSFTVKYIFQYLLNGTELIKILKSTKIELKMTNFKQVRNRKHTFKFIWKRCNFKLPKFPTDNFFPQQVYSFICFDVNGNLCRQNALISFFSIHNTWSEKLSTTIWWRCPWIHWFLRFSMIWMSENLSKFEAIPSFPVKRNAPKARFLCLSFRVFHLWFITWFSDAK